VIFLLLPAAVLVAALLYQAAGTARDRRRYPVPGRIIDSGGTKLHLHEEGQGSPAVILESGIGASSLSWAVVQPQIAAFTRVISYDRAGLGWSPFSRRPRTVRGMVNELRSVLERANIPAPFVLVGHSFGGLLVRAYASQYPNEVAGLVLVDPVSIAFWADCPDSELQRLQLGVRLCKRGAWAARFGVVRAALAALMAGRYRFPSVAARLSGQKGATAMTNLVSEVQKLPPELWPVVRSHWSDPKCFRALAGYLQCLPESARHAAQMRITPGMPLIILSASNAKPEELQERDRWVRESGAGKHIQVPDSGHWLHLEHPDAVVAAVQEVMGMAR
jgi:pimeloyl-ACP methyl ester carboxylesterase